MLHSFRRSQISQQNPIRQGSISNSIQGHTRYFQNLIDNQTEMQARMQRDEDKAQRIMPPSPPSQEPLDKIKRVMNMGILIELVESLKMKREFLDLLENELNEYYGRDSEENSDDALPWKSERSALDDRFGAAIFSLYQLYCGESSAEALFAKCFATYQMQRIQLIMDNIDNRCSFKTVLKKLIHFDKDPEVAEKAYKELKIFSYAHELIYNIKYDLKYKKLTRKSYEKKLKLIYNLSITESQYIKFDITTCSPFLNNRGDYVKYFGLHIEKEVISMLSIMKDLKEDLDASEINGYERCDGPSAQIDIVEVTTVPSPSPSPRPLYIEAEDNKEKPCAQSGQRYVLTKEDQDAIREGFFKFYRRYTPKPSSIGFKTDSQNNDDSSIFSDSDSDSDSGSDSDSDWNKDTDKESIILSCVSSDFDDDSDIDSESSSSEY